MHHGDEAPPPKRRRRRGSGSKSRTCPHCGRNFKRTEHLERHVRTHTKEKPFVCHCGAAFTRRDLLTRHHRIALHEEGETHTPAGVTPETVSSIPSLDQQADVAETPGLSFLAPGAPVHDLEQWQPQVQPPQQAQTVHHHQPGDSGMYGSSDIEPQQCHQPILPTQFFDNSTLGVGFESHFREFANFLDGVGLPAEWSPYFNGPDDNLEPVWRGDAAENGGSGALTGRPGTRPGTPFSSWLPSAPPKDRVPQALSEHSSRILDPDIQPYRVTDEQRNRLTASVETFRDLLDANFKFPSRHALTRHITSFFEGFHSHMPFIHSPTWRISEHSPELVLAISAIGSQYCFEHRNSKRLFYAGKAILLERLRHECDRFGPKTRSYLGLPHHGVGLKTPQMDDLENSRDWGSWDTIETVRALILLMGYATWEPEVSVLQEAFTLQGLLAQVLRDIGLHEAGEPELDYDHNALHIAWQSWVNHESTRRAKLIAFSFLHTHSLAYNVYPVLRSNEINLRLPCSTREWKAQTPQLWLDARRDTPKEQLYFQDALSILLKKADGTSALDPLPTPLANYLLLHGLLQRIYIVRDLSLPVMDHSAALPAEEVDKLESGLRSWTAGWQQAPESSLDPNNENGPIPFTSSSLLGLAYARIYLHLGPYRQLETRDPVRIAKAISRSPRVDRSDGVISALLYSIHMLSIPVRLGVDRVARSQAFFWSVRHSLAGLECAVLLSKWLFSLARSVGTTPLSDSEGRIVHWVWCIVDEAYSVVDFDDVDAASVTVDREPATLGLAVLRIWAYFFKSNTQWPFINIIGRSLEKYREMEEETVGHQAPDENR